LAGDFEVAAGSVYDFPKYYDVIFAPDWRVEYEFLQTCFQWHARRSVRRVFEPACGTGRLLVKLAAAGYDVSGNDLNPKAIAYCNARLARQGFAPSAVVGDMSDFRLRPPADAAFNMINSFRHLPSEEAAQAHLRCMAQSLAKGGIYVLGLHFTPRRNRMCDDEVWSGRRGSLLVMSRMWTIRVDHRRRQEHVGMTYDVSTPRRRFRLEDRMVLRTYTPRQFDDLVARVPSFEVVETYDFGYDIDNPLRVTTRTEDVVYVLRKR
jgi:SAM-dependent methyltransferase